ncbi:MAG: antibiotic biosynthesis monooxygenase [Candidatus Kerfeldbacteria bacterium]|nr:antibiotic biosynthesis monooxygenase [Candidatus Kerfeldbacteria bacterium]
MKFLFTIKLKPGATEQQYVDAWKKGSAIIQQSEGAQGTVLYRSLDGLGRFIAIATWESKAARDAAMKKLKEAALGVRQILNRHKEFGETTILGNFEEVAEVRDAKTRPYDRRGRGREHGEP